jgi:hypothetical protein
VILIYLAVVDENAIAVRGVVADPVANWVQVALSMDTWSV